MFRIYDVIFTCYGNQSKIMRCQLKAIKLFSVYGEPGNSIGNIPCFSPFKSIYVSDMICKVNIYNYIDFES